MIDERSEIIFVLTWVLLDERFHVIGHTHTYIKHIWQIDLLDYSLLIQIETDIGYGDAVVILLKK